MLLFIWPRDDGTKTGSGFLIALSLADQIDPEKIINLIANHPMERVALTMM